MLPSIRLSSEWAPVPPSDTRIPSWLLPEMTFPAPAAVPPTTVVGRVDDDDAGRVEDRGSAGGIRPDVVALDDVVVGLGAGVA